MNKLLFIQFFLIIFSTYFLVPTFCNTIEATITDYTQRLGYSLNNDRYVSPTAKCYFSYAIRIDYNDTPPTVSFANALNYTKDSMSSSKTILYYINYQFSPGESGTIDMSPISSGSTVFKLNQLTLKYICNAFNNSLEIVELQTNPQDTHIRGFAGYCNSLVKIKDMPQLLQSKLEDIPVTISKANGYRYAGFNTIGNNIRVISNYIYFSLSLYYKATQPMTQTNDLILYISTTSSKTINLKNSLYSLGKGNDPVSLSTQTFPTSTCTNLFYWHCYDIETYSSSDSDGYYFYTFQDNYLYAVNLNFKIWTNATHSKYLNIFPASPESATFTFAYYKSDYFFKLLKTVNTVYNQSNTLINAKATSFVDSQGAFQGLNTLFTSTYGGPMYVSSITFGGIKKYINYPFGVTGINHESEPKSNTLIYDFDFPVHQYYNGPNLIDTGFDLLQLGRVIDQSVSFTNNIISDNQPPKLFLYDYEDISISSFSIIIGASDDLSGVGTMFINLCTGGCIFPIAPSDLIQGTTKNGIYKLVLDKIYFGVAFGAVELTLIDRSGNMKVYKAGDIYNENLDYVKLVPYISPLTVSPDQITELYFDNNQLPNNVVNEITMFIKTNPIIPNYQFSFTPNYRIVYQVDKGTKYFHDEIDKPFKSTFNSATGFHEIKITVPAHLNPGQILYVFGPANYDNVFLFGLFGQNATLNSTYASPSDIMPPIISSVLTPVQIDGEIPKTCFAFTIQDDVNGLDHGLFTIISDYNLIGWNITVSPILNNTDPNSASYNICAPINTLEREQTYRISYVWLVDRQGHVSEWPSLTKVSPFAQSISSLLVLKTTSTVTAENDPPTLVNFVARNIITSNDGQTKSVDFQVTVGDTGSGVSTKYPPIVYLSSVSMEVIKSTLINSTNSGGDVVFTVRAQFPYSFGCTDVLALSIYGITDNDLNIAGYSTKSLQSKGFVYFINNTIPDGPEIINVIYENQLIKINGHRLGYKSTTLIVRYSTSSKYDDRQFTIANFNDKYVESNAIASTDLDNYIQVAIKTSDGLVSQFKNLKIPGTGNGGGNNGGGSTNPTTTPKTCPGSPVCGGPSKGICGTDGVTCNCIPPNSGTDCSLTNTGTNGTVDPTKPNVGFDYTKDAGIYKSLIVIDSLEEIDFNGNVVKTYPFKDWSFVKIDEDHFQFNNSFQTTSGIDQTSKTTNIIVKIDRYHQTTIINFANQNYSIEPNSVKYSIDMDQYKFQSKLNTLHLLMKTSLESNQDNVCSSSQFGDAGDSLFTKIQIDTLVLYGKFLKRGVIDGLVTTIKQVPVTSTSSSNSAQSFIAMQVPYYENDVSLDPNFSVLVDTRSTNEDDPNAICSKKSNGLTTAQLIGIIVGGAFFLVVVVIMVGIILFRHNTGFRLLYYRLFKKGLKKKVNGF